MQHRHEKQPAHASHSSRRPTPRELDANQLQSLPRRAASSPGIGLRPLDYRAFDGGRRADDVRGHKVIARGGEEVGTVDELLLDSAAAKVRLLCVSTGGAFERGSRRFLVPVDAVLDVADLDILVDHTRARLLRAPRYRPALLSDETYVQRVYNYYGCPPYWAPGCITPPYPFDHPPSAA